MDSKFFELDLPNEIKETVLIRAAGKRFRFPPFESHHNPLYRKKRNKQICEMGWKGSKIDEIAEMFKISHRHVKRILKDNGIRTTLEKRKNRKIELELLLSLGYTRKGIAEKLGISRQRLYQIMKEEKMFNKS